MPLRKIVLLTVICTLSFLQCTTVETLFIRSLMTIYPAEKNKITLHDGYRATYYTFTLGDQQQIDTYIFALPGSDPASVQLFHFILKDYPGNARVFALQKRYLPHNSTPKSKPPATYHQYNHLSQWIPDQVDFIKQILKNDTSHIPYRLLLGTSEGGALAPAVAQQLPQLTHMAVLGDGGMKGIDAFRIWGKRNETDFDQIYEVVTREPVNDKFIGPYTYLYWKEVLDNDPMDYLPNLDIPLFYAMGAKDQAVPIESLSFLQDTFTEMRKLNLTTRIYPDCNHELEDSKGNSHLKTFMNDMYTWMHKN